VSQNVTVIGDIPWHYVGMSSRSPQPANSRLDWAARKLAGNALTADDVLLDFEEGHLRRFGDEGAEKPVVTQPRWLRALPFARGLAIVTYTRTQLLFLADGFGVNCSLVAVHRAELDASNRQTFAFRRHECPLAMLELEPVYGEWSRQFLDGLLAVRDQERRSRTWTASAWSTTCRRTRSPNCATAR
jgi:hypothetical protein